MCVLDNEHVWNDNVVSDLVAVPESAGAADPRSILRPPRSTAFADPASRTLPDNAKPPASTYPHPCLRVTRGQEPALRRKLLRSRMCVLVPEHLVARRPDGRPLVGGLFCVSHKELLDRLICDRRPINWEEVRLGWARLPHGCQFCRVILHPDEHLRGSGDDLRTYFYQLQQLEELIPRNCVGRVFSGEGYEEFGGVASERYYLGFRVIGMGDLNAVDVAQACHVDATTSNTSPPFLMEYGSPLPDQVLLKGIYIDDTFVVSVCPRASVWQASGPDFDEIQSIHSSYARNHLPRAEEKGFGFCASQSSPPKPALQFVTWGTAVDSYSCKVGVPAEKRGFISLLGLLILTRTTVPKAILMRFLALLIHPFMHRREVMACLHRVHVWMAAYPDGSVLLLPPDVRDELYSACLLVLVAHSNMRWPVSTRITATDATPPSGGAVQCEVK